MTNIPDKKDIFISYRRSSGSADAIYLEERLAHMGYSVFLDVRAHEDGKFSAKLIRAITECTDFLLLCTENSLDGCTAEDDVVRQEIALVLSLKAQGLSKHIIPILKPPFEFPEELPDDINDIRLMDGVSFPPYDLIDSLTTWLETNLHSKRHINQSDRMDSYYRYVNSIFEEVHENSVLGNASRSTYYIPAYYRGSTDDHPLTEFLSDWLNKKTSGVALLHGEPGHGKTTFCLKTLYDFSHGERSYLKGIQNVFWFSLNPSNSDILDRDRHSLELKNIFSWAGGSTKIPPEELRNSLVFLDGFDEFLPAALKYISPDYTLEQFLQKIIDFARGYQLHIVVTSRSFIVNPSIERLWDLLPGTTLRMAPLSREQQFDWIKAHMPDYLPTFSKIVDDPDSDLSSIIGIPLIFRMVAALRFERTAENVVDFYEKLLDDLLKKRDIFDQRDAILLRYEELSYLIFQNDENSAEIDYLLEKDQWIYSFYVSSDHSRRNVGFIHKSFYQFFLAHFFYRLLIHAENREKAEDFLSRLADRKLDPTVVEYIRIIAGKNQHALRAYCKRILGALAVSEGILPSALGTHYGSTASSSGTDRIANIIYNTASLMPALGQPIVLWDPSPLTKLLRTYGGTDINLEHAKLEKADFRHVRFSNANLFGSELAGSNFSQADLTYVNMTRAVLDDADLTRANLTRAKLISASCKNAVFRYADLNGADFSLADLTGADFTGSDVSNTIFDNAKLTDIKGIDVSPLIEQAGEKKNDDTESDSIPEYFFVSYSSRDSSVVLPIIRRLRDDGYKIWYAPDSIKPGTAYAKVITGAISNSNGTLCFISESFGVSRWAGKELDVSLAYDKVLIPVYLSDIDLPPSLEFRLFRHQYIRYYAESDFDSFIHRLESAMDYVLHYKK